MYYTQGLERASSPPDLCLPSSSGPVSNIINPDNHFINTNPDRLSQHRTHQHNWNPRIAKPRFNRQLPFSAHQDNEQTGTFQPPSSPDHERGEHRRAVNSEEVTSGIQVRETLDADEEGLEAGEGTEDMAWERG